MYFVGCFNFDGGILAIVPFNALPEGSAYFARIYQR